MILELTLGFISIICITKILNYYDFLCCKYHYDADLDSYSNSQSYISDDDIL